MKGRVSIRGQEGQLSETHKSLVAESSSGAT